MKRRVFVVLLVGLILVPFWASAQGGAGPSLLFTLNFDGDPLGPGPLDPAGTEITLVEPGGAQLRLRLTRGEDPLTVTTIGLPGWGAGSLSTFNPDPLMPNGAPVRIEVVDAPPGYGLEGISFQMGDFLPSDIDDLYTSTIAGPEGIDAQVAGNVVVSPDLYDNPPADPSFSSTTVDRQRALGIRVFEVAGGSFNFPGSVYYDNFTFRLRPTVDGTPFGAFANGVDTPESNFGGDPRGDQLATSSGEGDGVVVYAVEAFTDRLYTVDLATGGTTEVGRLWSPEGGFFQAPSAMAVRPSDDAIFIWNNGSSDTDPNLGLATVNRAAGNATLVGPSAITTNVLAFDADDVLYSMLPENPPEVEVPGFGPGPLTIVDQATGEMTSLGGPDLPMLTGLEYNDADGYLYGITPSLSPTLVRIDRTDGSIVAQIPLIQPAGLTLGGASGLLFDVEGRLHASTGNPTAVLFEIDIATGQMSNVRETVLGGIAGLGITGKAAAPVVTPVPPTLTLLLNGQPFDPPGAVEWTNGKQLPLTVVGADGNAGDAVTVTADLTDAPGAVLSAQVGTNPGERILSWTPQGEDDRTARLIFRATSGADLVVKELSLVFPPDGVDTDGDGLLDTWENNGYDFETEDGEIIHVDLPGLGADPNIKDVFFVVDYMVGQESDATGTKTMTYDHRPTDAMLQLVKDAFTPPSGDPRHGNHEDVTLHVLVRHKLDASGGVILGPDGNPLPRIDFVSQLGQIAGGNYVWTAPKPGSPTHFDDIKNAHFAQELRQAMYYCVFAHKVGGTYTGMARGAPESDSIVSLGDLLEFRAAAPEITDGSTVTPTNLEQGGTFMHEVGHCLGLRHGGDEEVFYKPNYLSVMNLVFQLSGLRHNGENGLLDYSFIQLPDLDETDLDEFVGLVSIPSAPDADPLEVIIRNYGTTWFFRPGELPRGVAQRWTSNAAGPVNWYVDSLADPPSEDALQMSVAVDINRSGTQTVLRGHDDWDNLNFLGGVKGTGAQLPRPASSPLEGLTLDIALTLQPGGITTLRVHHTDEGEIVLTWKRVASKRMGFRYNVYRSTNGGDPVLLATTDKSNYHDETVNDVDTYAYFVHVVNPLGRESAPQEQVVETPKGDDDDEDEEEEEEEEEKKKDDD